MGVDDRQQLVNTIRGHVGDGLRVVAEYADDGYDVIYAREDVEPRLPHTADDVHEELILRGLGREHLETIFDAGDLHCSMHRFDDLTAFHFLRDDFSGLFVSVDSHVDVPLATFTTNCEEFLAATTR